jgi:hypothetical protein
VKPYIVVLLLVVGVLGGFYGGYRIGHSNVSASTAGSQTSRVQGGSFGGGRGGGGFAAACPSPGAPSPSPGANAVARGAVTDLTSSSLTITSTACDVKVSYGSTVQVAKTVAGSTGDLKDDITVTVIDTRQADGSIKATTIQIGGGGVLGNPGAAPSGVGG